MRNIDLEIATEIESMCQRELEDLLAALDGYEETPVHIDEFLDSDRFLGKYFEGTVFPYWRNVMREIYPSPYFSPYWLIAFRGSIGQGKTSIGCAGFAYDLYKLLVLAAPQKHYGLVPSTVIVFGIMNITMKLAQGAIWDKLSQMLVQSPFFSRLMRALDEKKRYKEQTLFPKFIEILQGSRFTHALGKAIFEALIDEANFEVIENQTIDSFNALVRRMESRFMESGGGVPGKIWVISSETEKSASLNTLVESYRGKSGVYVSDAAIWEVVTHRAGRALYSGKTFPLFVGSDTRQPEILADDSKMIEATPEHILWVPVEHRDAFDADLHAALRDIGGKPTVGSYKLFRLREKLACAMTVSKLFPDTFQLDYDDENDQIVDYLINQRYFANPMQREIPRYLHIDIGVTGDRFGIAAAFVSGFRRQEMVDPATLERTVEEQPLVTVEWAVGIEPTPGKAIPLYKARIFLKWLSKNRYPIAGITADGFESTEMLQLLGKMGFTTSVLSVDRTSDPYRLFRSAVYEGRCFMPNSKLLKRECEELELSADGRKVDHPKKNLDGSKGSKDVADGTAGAVYSVLQNAHKYKLIIDTMKNPHAQISPVIKDMFWGHNN